MIRTDSLSRSFGTKKVLSDVTLHVRTGSVCSLLGPNGAGKTTLLKLLMGLIEPDGGIASLSGDAGLPRSAAALSQTGCLIDDFEPPGNTQVGQLLSLCADVSEHFDSGRARTLLKEKQLSVSTTWKSMSKGQKRWALLTLLLCRRCQILLLDEPADGLDPETRQQLYQLIRREANDHGLTALIATHIIADVEKITDEVCVLKEGKVLLNADLEDLREQVVAVELQQQPNLPSGVQLLGSRHSSTFTCWLRDCDQLLPDEFSGEISRRHPSLEELYLALVSHSSDSSGSLIPDRSPVNLHI